jgi:glycosyltransferase involved in cell wall biosynthesis
VNTNSTIAFYTDSPPYGGAEASLGTLVSELDAGLDVILAGIDAAVIERLAARRPGGRTRAIPAVRDKWDVSSFVANVREIRALGCGIFQANLHVPSACQYALGAAALTPGLRTLAVEHLPHPLHGRLQRSLKRFTSRRLAAHVAVGERVARDVEELAGLAPGSVRTIHNGVPDVDLRPMPRPFDGPVVGSLGRLDRQKGYDVLLRALAELPDARLVIVGEGDQRGALERLAAELGIGERVRFEGWHEEPRPYLTMFDVFVLPSRFEGFPLSIVEAMLARLPVVATAVGSVPEAVADQSTGRLIPPENPAALAAALRELLDDPERRARMGARGRQRALVFTPAAMARAYERLYEEILA